MNLTGGIVSIPVFCDSGFVILSSLNNAHNTIFPKIIAIMKEKELDNVLLIGGGIIPKKDIESLEASGVGKLYGPGTPVNETIDYITNWVKKNRR